MSSVDPSAGFRGPIAWMAKNSVAANLLMFVIVLTGAVGATRVIQEVFPNFTLDVVSVSVPYPGASPAEVEQGIVLAIEEEVRGLDGVKRVTSSSSEGVGVVNVELLLGEDINKALNDVKTAVDRIQSFPEEAERPTVSASSGRREVISVVIAGDQPLSTLQAIAEKARASILEHPDVTQVEVFNVPPLEVAIEVSREKLEALGLSLDDVARQVRAASIELPGGEIETKKGEILVRVADRRIEGHQFEDVVLKGTRQGYSVRLGDVATIRDGYADTDQSAFYEGKPAVRITAYRIGDETPKKVADAVRAHAEALDDELPDNITVAVWRDDSEFLTGRIDLLVRNARAGLVLVLVILAMFLRLRLAGWVAVGIPISFLGALALMPAVDLSINMVTLFGFIVTLGMVVADAIIVGENVYTRVERGTPRLQAAIEGAREMAVPITFAILTTVAAFSPLFFVPGIMGKIFRMIPAVVCSVLLFSLIESFFVLPAHLGHGSEAQPRTRIGRMLHSLLQHVDRFQGRIASGLEWFTANVYKPNLERALRLRYITLAGAIATLIGAVGLVGAGIVPFSFFPKLEGDQVTAAARLPFGAPADRSEEIRQQLEASARQAVAEMGGASIYRGMYTRLGEGPRGRGPGPQGSESGSHLVTVEINLVPSAERTFSSAQFAAAWQKHTPPLAGLQALLFNHSAGPGAGADVAVQLSHTETQILADASAELTDALRGYGNLTNVENGYSAGKPQLDFHLKPSARTLGLTATDVARQMRAAFFGAEAAREQRGRNEMKVMVRLPESERRSEHDLEQLEIRTPTGGQVPMHQVATFERSRAPTSIDREDGRRIVTVGAELAPGVESPREIIESVQADVLPELKRKYPGLRDSLVGQQREQGEAFASMKKNFIIALFAIFALLAIPFKSYIQPLIVMSAIPFGFVGAILGHLIMGFGLSIISIFGIIALAGVVVNDSLVLIDATNKRRAEGAYNAIVYGATRRLRPILLTSLTTFFGLAPMITETSIQARFLIPMAISLGFGVLFATVIVLLVVPALYLIVEDARQLFSRDEPPVDAPEAASTSSAE